VSIWLLVQLILALLGLGRPYEVDRGLQCSTQDPLANCATSGAAVRYWDYAFPRMCPQGLIGPCEGWLEVTRGRQGSDWHKLTIEVYY